MGCSVEAGWRQRTRKTGGARGSRKLVCLLLAGMVGAATGPASSRADDKPDRAKLEAELKDTESAFARTMADRDHAAFASFLSEEALFIGQKETLRGKKAVADGWRRFFEGDAAPFSWLPERVEVLDSGSLGLTSGPVRDPEGTVVGTFNSIWRREGKLWRIVFDKGCPPCP